MSISSCVNTLIQSYHLSFFSIAILILTSPTWSIPFIKSFSSFFYTYFCAFVLFSLRILSYFSKMFASMVFLFSATLYSIFLESITCSPWSTFSISSSYAYKSSSKMPYNAFFLLSLPTSFYNSVLNSRLLSFRASMSFYNWCKSNYWLITNLLFSFIFILEFFSLFENA